MNTPSIQRTLPGLLATVLLGLLVLTGCEAGSAVAPPSASMQHAEFTPIMHPEGAPFVASLMRANADEKKRLLEHLEEALEVQRIMTRAIRASATWQAIDARVRNTLNHYAQHPLSYQIEQVLASSMLSEQLLKSETTAAMQEATAFYTGLLLNNEYPDASVIAPALQSLDGYWSASALNQASASAARYAEAWLAKNPCVECLGEGVQREDLKDARQQRIYAIQSTLPRLKEMRMPRKPSSATLQR